MNNEFKIFVLLKFVFARDLQFKHADATFAFE